MIKNENGRAKEELVLRVNKSPKNYMSFTKVSIQENLTSDHL
jgi:hypothetical protein